MAVVWDARAGRLVRETEAERQLREAEARNERDQFETDQSRWDRMRTMSRDEQRSQQAYRQRQQDARLQPPPPPGFESAADIKKRQQAEQARANAIAKARAETAKNVATRQAGLNAATGFEELARGGSEEALARIAGLYEPQFSAAESARADELRLLRDALTGAGTQIDAATQEYLQNLAPTRAFENVPLLALEAEQNPLLEALRSQGAGTAEVEAQGALDTALANQLRQLAERSAQQYGATESAYVDALRRSALGGQMAGQQYLATRGREAESAIGTRYADLLNELRSGRAEAEADVATTLQNALAKALETRAEAESIPVPKKKETAKPATKPTTTASTSKPTVTTPTVTAPKATPKKKTGASTVRAM